MIEIQSSKEVHKCTQLINSILIYFNWRAENWVNVLVDTI
jgi:hypothetical protein